MYHNNPSHSAEELRDAHSPLHNEVNELAGAMGGIHLDAQVNIEPESFQINHGFQLITVNVHDLFYNAQRYTLNRGDYQSFFALEPLSNQVHNIHAMLEDIAFTMPPHGNMSCEEHVHEIRALTINETITINNVLGTAHECIDTMAMLPADCNYNVSFSILRERLVKIQTGCIVALQRNLQPTSMIYRLHLDQIN